MGDEEEPMLAPSFPEHLRVLVVDDDPLCLMIVAKMLRRCNYEVSTSSRAAHALQLLRDGPGSFDIVLSDVYMPDLDGFKLMECIALEMDVPVIMMSANGDTSVVLRGITAGAVDYLLKPVRIEELRNLWQHVVRRRQEGSGGSPPRGPREGRGAEKALGRTSKEKGKRTKDGSEGNEEEEGGGHVGKKARVVWTVELHQQFVNAVNSLGVDKAVPKRILDLMGVHGLTRENVASHLQKYRLYLKRLQSVQAEQAGAERRGGGGRHAQQQQQHALQQQHEGQQSLAPLVEVPPLLPPSLAQQLPGVPTHFRGAAMHMQAHLPGTAPGGGYPAHLLHIESRSSVATLRSDIAAVSQMDLGIHDFSMAALGGDTMGPAQAACSDDSMLQLFLKDALPLPDSEMEVEQPGHGHPQQQQPCVHAFT